MGRCGTKREPLLSQQRPRPDEDEFLWSARRSPWLLPSASLRLSGTVHHLAGQHGLAGELVAHVSPATDLAGGAAKGEHIHFNAKLVPGCDRLAELGPLDAGEDHDLVCAVFNFHQQQQSSRLAHRLHHQYPWHEWILREVSLEKRFVDGDILDSYDPLLTAHFSNAVQQQVREAVENDPHDL